VDQYQTYIHQSRYARWLPEEERRESWPETVDRLRHFWFDSLYEEGAMPPTMAKELDTVFGAVVDLEVMPSMRSLMTAGPALERDNVAGFNCAYLPIDHPRAFDELMYILLCGTGVGFSVERQYVDQLPEVPDELYDSQTTISVPDSKVGWAKSFRQLVALLYAGEVPRWDTGRVRPAGAPLKTFGGRASGPEPLESLFTFTVETFQGAKGRQLSDLEAHDLCCKIAETIVVGGVRRSALLSLSNPTSARLRNAKSGQWWTENPQRALSNNSACYTDKPDLEFFINEMEALHESKSGERGFFSRQAAQLVAGRNGRRETDWDFGTNPCSEIILRPNQFCNLTEVVVRAEDTLETLTAKVRKATILGTLQASLTDFRYLRKVWKTNTEEEALLGVSLTGIMDHTILSGRATNTQGKVTEKSREMLAEWLEELKNAAMETNAEWAEKLGINPAAAITCVKPSGTVSQLVNSSSGIHPRFATQYIRRVRGDAKDPLSVFLEASGVPTEPDATTPGTVVHSFPVEAPEGAVTADSMGAMDQLRLWKIYADHWCEHKPSITVYYTDEDSWTAWRGCGRTSMPPLVSHSSH